MIRIFAFAILLTPAYTVVAMQSQKYTIQNSSDLPEVRLSRVMLEEEARSKTMNLQRGMSSPLMKRTVQPISTHNVEIPVDVVKSVSPTSADLAIWAIKNSNYYSAAQQVALLQAIENVKHSEPTLRETMQKFYECSIVTAKIKREQSEIKMEVQ